MPLRSRLIIFGVVVMLLFLGLTAGSFGSLSAASRDAELAREELKKLVHVEAVEESCDQLEEGEEPVSLERARKALQELAQARWKPPSREAFDRLEELVKGFLAGGPPPDPVRLTDAVHRLKRAILARVERDLRLAELPAHLRAVRLLFAACLAAAGCSATFAWLYARMVRERKALEERVRRSEKLAALGTLAAGVAHEINNPLTSISMSVEAIRSRLPPETGIEPWLAAIQEESLRCLRIVGDLSDLARGGSLDREPVDPEDLAREALKIVRRNRPPGKVAIDIDVAPDLPLVSADRGKLLQILVNLLQNALEATDPDGHIVLSARKADGCLEFLVRDDGRGIPPHLADRIFDPFYTDKARGVGLGLTLCHRIAELHGGDLEVKSQGANQGATFTLSLPLEPKSDGT